MRALLNVRVLRTKLILFFTFDKVITIGINAFIVFCKKEIFKKDIQDLLLACTYIYILMYDLLGFL